MVMKPTNAHKCRKVCYVINTVFPCVSATLVAILREVPYKTWMYMEIIHQFVNHCTDVKCNVLLTLLKYKMQVKFL